MAIKSCLGHSPESPDSFTGISVLPAERSHCPPGLHNLRSSRDHDYGPCQFSSSPTVLWVLVKTAQRGSPTGAAKGASEQGLARLPSRARLPWPDQHGQAAQVQCPASFQGGRQHPEAAPSESRVQLVPSAPQHRLGDSLELLAQLFCGAGVGAAVVTRPVS